MNFRPIFRNRFKDDMKGVALFMALLLLCNAFIVSLLLVVSAQVQGQAFSNFSVAMSCFTLAIGAATVREDLRLGIQNGVSRGTSLTACFAANIAAAMVAALGVTLVEWACIYLRGTVRIGFYSIFALVYGEDASVPGQLRSLLLNFLWCGSMVFVGSFLSLIYWRLSKFWRWVVSLGMGAAALLPLNAAIILLLNASKASAGFLGWLLSFIRWLGEAPLNLVVFLAGIAAAFAFFDWLLTRRAPITAATA